MLLVAVPQWFLRRLRKWLASIRGCECVSVFATFTYRSGSSRLALFENTRRVLEVLRKFTSFTGAGEGSRLNLILHTEWQLPEWYRGDFVEAYAKASLELFSELGRVLGGKLGILEVEFHPRVFTEQ